MACKTDRQNDLGPKKGRGQDEAWRHLQPPVDALDVVVVEAGQHPQLVSAGVVAEADLTPVEQTSSRE